MLASLELDDETMALIEQAMSEIGVRVLNNTYALVPLATLHHLLLCAGQADDEAEDTIGETMGQA